MIFNSNVKAAARQAEIDSIDKKLGTLTEEEKKFLANATTKRFFTTVAVGSAVQLAVSAAMVLTYNRFVKNA